MLHCVFIINQSIFAIVRAGRYIFILFIPFLLYQCNSRVVTNPVVPFLERISNDSICMRMQEHIQNIDDSGYLGKLALNYPDSLFLFAKNKDKVEHVLNHLWNEQNWKHLTGFIKSADNHALDKEWYHYSALMHVQDIIVSKKWDSVHVVNYDSIAQYLLLAIDGSAGLIHDLSVGRLSAYKSGINNHLPQRKCDFRYLALENRELSTELSKYAPDFKEYNVLYREYNRLNELLKTEPKKGADIVALKGELNPLNADSVQLVKMQNLLGKRMDIKWNSFTKKSMEAGRKEVYGALVKFQTEFQLNTTGIFDKNTQKELHRDIKIIMQKLAASMERWRQIGPMDEAVKVVVNIAANELFAYKEDTLKLHFLVCSGKARDKEYYDKLELSSKPNSKTPKPDNLETPLMKANISHFVVNPTWSVPHNIATKEMLPDIIRNPSSLHKNHFVVRNKNGEMVNPYSVNWRKYSTRNFPFRIEQEFGDFNALGRIVVHFSNPYSIFLHDTPSKYAFGLADRHVSHGCVRMQLPFDMMEYLCSFNKINQLDKARIQAGLEPLDSLVLADYKKDLADSTNLDKYKPKPKQYFKLDKKIAIYLCYFTAFTNESGIVHYAEDSYQSDEKILAEMNSNYKRRGLRY